MSVVFDAVVLAGGQGSRMGGVSKADLQIGGRRLLDRVLAACAGAGVVVVVGDVEVPDGVVLTREDPPGTGPAAGLQAGLLASGGQPWTLVLACDLPGATDAVPTLLTAAEAARPDADGVCLARPDGGTEWLCALYRTPALGRAFDAYGDPRNRSVRGLIGLLSVDTVPGPAGSGDDVDTWEDHDRWNRSEKA